MMNKISNDVKELDFNIYFSRINEILQSLDVKKIEKIINIINQFRLNKKNIFIIGNGGSASTAEHMATDLMFGTKHLEPRIKSISLTSNSSKITATGNDIGFDYIFKRQLEVLANQKDLLIIFSASGQSKNLLEASNFAKSKKMFQVGILGFDGGLLKSKMDEVIVVNSKIGEYGPVEDIHLMINHFIVEKLKVKF